MLLEKLPESIGHALINQRAGMENVVYNQLFRRRAVARMDVRSVAFVFNGRIPTRFTADGEGVSPPVSWDSVPAGATGVLLIVEDADSPTPHPLVHAIVSGLSAADGTLPEGALSSPQHADPGSPQHADLGLFIGPNSFLQHAWLPPDPPRGHGLHRYVFQVFALGAGPTVSDALGRHAFIDLVLERAIGVGCIIGTYERSERASLDEPESVVIDDRSFNAEPAPG